MYQGKYAFVALAPAHDWFFVPDHAGSGYVMIQRVAAWGTTANGLTVGLRPVPSDLGQGVPARLEPLDNERGSFKHLDDLSSFEKDAVRRSR